MQTDCTAAPGNNVIVGKEYWRIGSCRANGLMYHAKKSLMNLLQLLLNIPRFEFMIHTSAALLAAVSFPPITTIVNNSMIMNTVNTCMQYIGL